MAPSERARKNHDELFPGHVSTLAVTDPELIEVFDNFAFDEVLSHGSLDARSRLMGTQFAAPARVRHTCEQKDHAQRGRCLRFRLLTSRYCTSNNR